MNEFQKGRQHMAEHASVFVKTLIEDSTQTSEFNVLMRVLKFLKPFIEESATRLNNCPFPAHHPTCECGGSGGDR